MINKVQATNYNPAFNATVRVTPEAANFLAKTKRIAPEELGKQIEGLKQYGDNNIAITIKRIVDDMRDGISVAVHKLTDGKKVFTGETEKYFYDGKFYNKKDSFDLIEMASSADKNSKYDQTLSSDMFKFM